MSLKKEDFTDEQWAEIQAEADRRVTTASETARKNTAKAAEQDIEARIEAAKAEERTRLEASEVERLDMERKKIDEDRALLAADRKSLMASKKLLGAGFDDKEVESLLPMFVMVDDKSLDVTLDAFITVNETRVKAKVDAAKQELLGNATPPNGPTDAPTDALHTANELAAAGQGVEAIDVLLKDAGY